MERNNKIKCNANTQRSVKKATHFDQQNINFIGTKNKKGKSLIQQKH